MKQFAERMTTNRAILKTHMPALVRGDLGERWWAAKNLIPVMAILDWVYRSGGYMKMRYYMPDDPYTPRVMSLKIGGDIRENAKRMGFR